MNELENYKLEELTEQSNFYIELDEILRKDKTKISITDGYDFVVKNNNIYTKYSLLTLKSIFSKDKKFKKALKIINSESFDTYMQAITLQLLKKSKESHIEQIDNEREKTQTKVNEVLSLTKQQEIIIKKAIQLEQKIFNLEEKIQENKEIIKKQSDNLKENIGLKGENISLKKKQEELIKLGRQFNKLVLEGKKLNILLDVNNGRGKVKFNSVAINAVNNFSVIDPTKTDSRSYSEELSSRIIKAGDTKEVETFELKQIGEIEKSSEYEEVSDPMSIKLMLDRINELEEKEKTDELEKIKLKEKLEKEKNKNEELKNDFDKQVKKNESLNLRINEQSGLLLKYKIDTTGLTIIDDEKKD